MTMMMIRATVKDELVAEAESASKAMFAALDDARPQGVRYASCRLADTATFLVFVDIEDGAENPLAAVPEWREFQQNLSGWVAESSPPEPLTVVGSYNLF